MAKQKEPHVTPDMIPDVNPDAIQEPGTDSPSEVKERLVKVTAERLNLRQGPGRDFPVKDVLTEGTVAAVLDLPYGIEVPGWALVHVSDEQIGWVDTRWIQEVED